MRRIRKLIRVAELFLIVARKSRYSVKVIGIRKLTGVVGLLRRVASGPRNPTMLPNNSQRGTACFVLGNGPSLSADINERLDIFRMGDTFCVNGFAENDLYKKIQPKYYVFADPWYWSLTSPENVVFARNHLFGEILSKTSWPLTIYVPFEAKDLFENIFLQTKNIRLSFYNNTQLDGDKFIVNILYELGLGMPPIQNVLIPTLFLALYFGYKTIILLGADHSWHETVSVDEDSRVCLRMRHFYSKDEKSVPWSMDGAVENLWTMDRVFHALARMFEGHGKIEEYAKHLGVQVYNASSITYIDAFKRRSLSDIRMELTEGASKEG